MSLMKGKNVGCLFLLFMASVVMAEVKVKDVVVKPRWPWNGLVDITYSIQCDELTNQGKPKKVYVDFLGLDNDRNRTVNMKKLVGDGAREPVVNGGPYTVMWNATKDEPEINAADFKVKIHASNNPPPYMVVDLTTWEWRYSLVAPDLSNDVCRTTELWMRLIPAGTFTMGAPSTEVGYVAAEDQHQVTLSKPYYIGIFECTQKQWSLVKGRGVPRNPRYSGDTRPQENVSYNDIRGEGSQTGNGWPTYGHAVDDSSFMGILRTKIGLMFDLPTEAEWEYACRAGTTTAYNSGKNCTYPDDKADPAMNEVGRYCYNTEDGKGGYSQHTKVGCYLPNSWGIYDMHGNVWELCLDWAYSYDTSQKTDPVGPESGSYRIFRGGSFNYEARGCRSAMRGYVYPYDYDTTQLFPEPDVVGFRVVCHPADE